MDPAASSAKVELRGAGTRLGRYHLLHRLAVGGMAELHLACAEGLAGFQKVVVVKHVLPHLALDPDFVRLFLNEARLAATLDHANIVQVSDIGEADGDFFYVMEYVHGINAREVLRAAAKAGELPLDVAVAIGIAAASGLHHAHQATDIAGERLGLVHRDVSPANLLVSYNGAVKLTDFGIAKAAARSKETIGGAVKGKIGYMSPEQIRGEAVDCRSDVFSLGVVLYELTTCQRLFFADNDFAILNKIIAGTFDAPSKRIPDYPPELEAIVLRALATDRSERYGSADEVRRDLEAFAHEHRIRVSPATVAAWMAGAFGRPAYPRVELTQAGSKLGPAVPTLVVATAGGTEVAFSAGGGEGSASPPPGRRRAWVAAGGLAIAGLAAWTWVAVAGDAVQEPANGAAAPAAPIVAAPVPNRDLADPEQARAAATEDPSAPPAVTAPATPVAPPAAAERTRAPRRGKGKRRKKPKGDRKAPVRDIGALYPVGG